MSEDEITNYNIQIPNKLQIQMTEIPNESKAYQDTSRPVGRVSGHQKIRKFFSKA